MDLEEWLTHAGDRPLLVQFCANDPDTLLAAAKLVAELMAPWEPLRTALAKLAAGEQTEEEKPLRHSLEQRLRSALFDSQI